MLRIEVNHVGASMRMLTDNMMLYRRWRDPVDVAVEVNQHTMEAVNKNRTEGTKRVPTVVPDP